MFSYNDDATRSGLLPGFGHITSFLPVVYKKITHFRKRRRENENKSSEKYRMDVGKRVHLSAPHAGSEFEMNASLFHLLKILIYRYEQK